MEIDARSLLELLGVLVMGLFGWNVRREIARIDDLHAKSATKTDLLRAEQATVERQDQIMQALQHMENRIDELYRSMTGIRSPR